ncbi:MAG TPA: T9SS C-terminal target domain-containing protein, partial [Bacteroidetes bacterium]|nr:T9SS C-terminal target domain-containing protein [Bacteroidota bacterium]
MKIILPKPFLLAIIVLLATRAAIPQPGCTDPLAINYDPSATENDGSCLYPPTTYQPAEIATLALTECSGLIYFDDHLWTLLDSGNPDNIYELDTLTGAVIQTQAIPNADNKDWEDFAQDAEHIYIGDFGNNGGDRTDLRIYKIKKTDLLAGNPDPQLIEFVFSDQTDFTPAHNANNYDCEAFFFRDDSLHLFSKNWLDFKTRHYVLPAQPGSHTAQLRDSLFVQGQITSADISENGTVLLLGYNTSTSETFLWLLFDFDGNRFFSGNKRRISLGSALTTSQVEGIAFSDTHRGYICSERFSVLPPKLLMFDIAPYISGPVA